MEIPHQASDTQEKLTLGKNGYYSIIRNLSYNNIVDLFRKFLDNNNDISDQGERKGDCLYL